MAPSEVFYKYQLGWALSIKKKNQFSYFSGYFDRSAKQKKNHTALVLLDTGIFENRSRERILKKKDDNDVELSNSILHQKTKK